MNYFSEEKKAAFFENKDKFLDSFSRLHEKDGFEQWLSQAKGVKDREGRYVKTPLANKNDNWAIHAVRHFIDVYHSGMGDMVTILDELQDSLDDFRDFHDETRMYGIAQELRYDPETRNLIEDIHNGWRKGWFGVTNRNILHMDDGTSVTLSFNDFERLVDYANISSVARAVIFNLDMFESNLKNKSSEEVSEWLYKHVTDLIINTHKIMMFHLQLRSGIWLRWGKLLNLKLEEEGLKILL